MADKLSMSFRDKVLFIDDDPQMRELVSEILSERYHVILSGEPDQGLTLAKNHKPGVIVIDMMMPKMNGIEFMRHLRAESTTRSTPVLMLTGMDQSAQRVEAFKAGVDDFLSKPFLPEELLARVESKMRWTKEAAPADARGEFSFGDLRIVPAEIKVFLKDQPVDISPAEFKILWALVRAEGQIVERARLAEIVLGKHDASERGLDPHVSSLRKKLRGGGSAVELKTVYGSGYALST